MPSTNHAEHFLSRVDRLNGQQAELALGLYRDAGLLRFVLQRAHLPPRGEDDRVAISLGPRDQGPYVIVTRDGKFVTCLAEGMALHEGQPLITRRTLDDLGGKVEALRDLLEETARGGDQRTEQLLQRLFEAGATITQREFDDLVVWSPLMSGRYLEALLLNLERLERTYDALSRHKRLGKRASPLLRKYWQAMWAAAHLTMLVGEQPKELERIFEHLDAERPDPEGYRRLFILPLWRTGLMPWGIRGAWLAARVKRDRVI